MPGLQQFGSMMVALREKILRCIDCLAHDNRNFHFVPADIASSFGPNDLEWHADVGLMPGYYRLTLKLKDGVHQLSSERLHIQNLGGAWETTYLQFLADREANCVADFPLPNGAQAIRLSPRLYLSPISIQRACIRRIRQAERYLALATRMSTLVLCNKSDLTKLVKRGISLICRHGIGSLVSRILYPKYQKTGSNSYSRWIEIYDTLSKGDLDEIRATLRIAPIQPRISLVLPVKNAQEKYLRSVIDSVIGQVYVNWELCVAGDYSSEPGIRRFLDECSAMYPNVKVAHGEVHGDVAVAFNFGLALATGEWIAPIGQDDVLSPNALAEVVLEINRYPSVQLVYTDADGLDESEERHDPQFKPDFSLPLFQSHDFLHNISLHRRENVMRAGGWRSGFEGSEEYDLNLRLVERMDHGDIRHIPKILYHSRKIATHPVGLESGLRALREHIGRLQLPAKAEMAVEVPCYRMHFDVPVPNPLVSLIIPTRDQAGLLRNCIESIVDKTEYENYEIIIIDNGSVEAETTTYFEELKGRSNIVILRYTLPFNYAAINNFAVGKANGTIIGLINNDIEVISSGWLTEMVSWASQPHIGCVGAKLYYGNGTIQHGGIILGVGGTADHAHKHFPGQHPGYFYRLKVHQNFSAVTGACLIVRKELFAKVGGLDQDNLAIAFNDVDFCLKIQDAGYANIWTPYAELYHLESISRGGEDSPEKKDRFEKETNFMLAKWNLANDPYYSPNLTRSNQDFSLRWPSAAERL